MDVYGLKASTEMTYTTDLSKESFSVSIEIDDVTTSDEFAGNYVGVVDNTFEGNYAGTDTSVILI